MIRRLAKAGEGARERAARPIAAADAPAATPRYFTDGVNLYRIVCWLRRPVEPHFAELEDCRSLDCTLVSSEDLVRLALRPVSIRHTG